MFFAKLAHSVKIIRSQMKSSERANLKANGTKRNEYKCLSDMLRQ
jgi:hypothetical protein